MTTSMTFNLIFAAMISTTVAGLLAWAIVSQSHDDGPIQRQEDAAHQAPAAAVSSITPRASTARVPRTPSLARQA